ncbi:MAG: hypothetical protein D6797_01585, partial [Bdellovibrio sp.]
ANTQTDLKWKAIQALNRWSPRQSPQKRLPILRVDEKGLFPRVDLPLVDIHLVPQKLKALFQVDPAFLDPFRNAQVRANALKVIQKNIESVLRQLDKNLTQYEIPQKAFLLENIEKIKTHYIEAIQQFGHDLPEEKVAYFLTWTEEILATYSTAISTLPPNKKLKVPPLLHPYKNYLDFEKKLNEYQVQQALKLFFSQLSQVSQEWGQAATLKSQATLKDLPLLTEHFLAVIKELIEHLRSQISLRFLETSRPKDIEKFSQKVFSEIQKASENIYPQVQKSHDNFILKFQNPKVSIVFEPQISSSLVFPFKNPFPFPDAPTLSLHHGHGTNQSNAKSYVNSVTKIQSISQANTIAHDMPMAGVGLSIPKEHHDPFHSATYAYQVAKFLREKQAAQTSFKLPNGQPYAPLIAIGRSAGSTIQNFLDFYYPDNPYDVHINTAFSNPLTIDEQLEKVYAEIEKGMIKNVDEKSIQYIYKLEKAFLEILKASPEIQKEAFNLTQLFSTYVIGMADEEGDLSANEQYAKAFTSLAHRWYLRDPIYGTSYADEENPHYIQFFNYLESKHYLLNPHDNVSALFGSERFSTLPMELLPKTRNQMEEVIAVSYATMDLCIQLLPLLKEARQQATNSYIRHILDILVKKAEHMKLYRDEFFLASRKEKTFLEWYFKNKGFSLQEVQNMNSRAFFAQQSKIRREFIQFEQTGVPVQTSSGMTLKEYQQADLLGRFKKIYQYFIEREPKRIKKVFKEKGYLP